MRKPHFYKNCYLIALYDEDDYPFIIADNVPQLAEMTRRNAGHLWAMLCNNVEWIRVDGKKYTIHLIRVK